MANQQIVDWIKQQDSQNYTSQQLYNSLVQQGYNPNEVNKAIKIASQSPPPINQSIEPTKTSINILPIIIIGVVVIGLISGGIFFFFSQNNKISSDTKTNSQNILTNKKTDQASKTELSECDTFPDKLESCEPFSCKFKHPFTNEIMEKKIIGLVNGKCQYTEEMPNNGKMGCNYSESLRIAVAQYYRDLVVAESAGTNIKANLGNGNVKTTYTINGKRVDNPLQEAMINGQCIISGYEKPQVDDKKNNTLNNKPTGQATLDSIKFDKDTYSKYSSARATIKISYEGNPFHGLILLKMSRDGFSGHKGTSIYSSYVKLIEGDTTINKPVAFTYSNRVTSWPSETSIYKNEGKYTYKFLLFDCNSIINEFNKECDEVEFGTDVFDDGLPSSKPLDTKIVSVDIIKGNLCSLTYSDCENGKHCFVETYENNSNFIGVCLNNQVLINITETCDENYSGCEQYTCDSCLKNHKGCFGGRSGWPDNMTNKCVECDNHMNKCKAGFSCKDYKCVPE
ncbi:hypothetical protein KAI92_03745 [Candidatus Parcubacteria bacterium]|nr:hypothetical protein [Candidatus Parcubacteria bacterium]